MGVAVTIESVEFHNYRCLKYVTLRLGPLTALVGPNATGKSTVLRGLEPSFTESQNKEAAWRRDHTHAAYRVVHMKEGRRYRWGYPNGLADAQLLVQETPPYTRQYLHLDVKALRGENLVQAEATLARDGRNVTNVFATLPRRTQTSLARDFCRRVPVFADVDARPSREGRHRLVFQDRWREDLWYEPSEVSDGSMLMLAFSLLQYQTEPPDLITIEEPEHGIHPYLMQQLVEMLRGIATGTIGPRAIQVVLATHSAELLEYLRPEEVRFLSRKDDGSVVIEEAPVNDPDWKRVYDEYQQSLGGLWLSGNLGGVPRSAA